MMICQHPVKAVILLMKAYPETWAKNATFSGDILWLPARNQLAPHHALPFALHDLEVTRRAWRELNGRPWQPEHSTQEEV